MDRSATLPVSFRLSAAELAEMDRIGKEAAARLGGVRRLSRTDVIRYLLAIGAREHGRQYPSPENDLEGK